MVYEMRKKCIVCNYDLFEEPLYRCKNMPQVSQNLPKESDLEKDTTIDLELCQCKGCGLIQFNCDPVDYYKDSTRAGERCEILIDLRQKQYKHLIEKYSLYGKKILEVGAGKGGFLKTLKEMKKYRVQEYGIENNSEFVNIAREQEGVNVFKGFIDSSDYKIEGAPFDAFTSFAFPARLIDPNSMLQGVYNNLKEDGIGLIQVPSFEHLLSAEGFFDITRDHIAYYSEETLAFLLKKNGFDVLESGRVAKIYIYAICKKRKRIPIEDNWKDIEKLQEDVYEFVNEKRKNGKKIAVWCAGHYAFTLLSTSGIGNEIEYIIDNAKFKQGCYSPGSHVKIVASDYFKENPVDNIIILGPIYVEEIVEEIKTKCSGDVGIFTIKDGKILMIS